MAGLSWLKLWVNVHDNPKIRALSDAEFRLLTYLWCLARRAKTPGHVALTPGVGIPAHQLTLSAGIQTSKKKASDMLRTLVGLKLIELRESGEIFVHNWEEWNGRSPSKQPSYQSEYKRQYRENIRGVSESPKVVRSLSENCPKTEEEEEEEEEKRVSVRSVFEAEVGSKSRPKNHTPSPEPKAEPDPDLVAFELGLQERIPGFAWHLKREEALRHVKRLTVAGALAVVDELITKGEKPTIALMLGWLRNAIPGATARPPSRPLRWDDVMTTTERAAERAKDALVAQLTLDEKQQRLNDYAAATARGGQWEKVKAEVDEKWAGIVRARQNGAAR